MLFLHQQIDNSNLRHPHIIADLRHPPCLVSIPSLEPKSNNHNIVDLKQHPPKSNPKPNPNSHTTTVKTNSSLQLKLKPDPAPLSSFANLVPTTSMSSTQIIDYSQCDRSCVCMRERLTIYVRRENTSLLYSQNNVYLFYQAYNKGEYRINSELIALVYE